MAGVARREMRLMHEPRLFKHRWRRLRAERWGSRTVVVREQKRPVLQQPHKHITIATMSQGTLYIHKYSPRSNWAGLLVKELGLDITVKFIQDNAEEFGKEFPLKLAPAFLGADGFKLTESAAVYPYLIDISKNDTLAGKNAKDRAQVTRWFAFLNTTVCDSWVQLLFKSKTDEEKAAAVEKLKFYASYIDSELSQHKYLAGDYITLADEYLYAFYPALGGSIGGVSAETYPHFAKWAADIAEKDPVAKALSAA